MTLQALADAAGCTKGYLSSIENDRRAHPPSAELLSRLEWALRMPVGSLVSVGNWEVTPEPVRRHVRDLESQRAAVRRLTELMRVHGIDAMHRSGELQRLVEHLSPAEPRTKKSAPGGGPETAPGRGRARNGPPGGAEEGSGGIGVPRLLPMQVPLINRVAAGYPTEFTDLGYPARVADEYVSVPDVEDADAFAARVIGDSMEPQYREGDIVVFSPGTAVTSGRDCFVRFERDAETTFKRVFFEEAGGEDGTADEGAEGAAGGLPGGRLRLQPLNPKYAAREVDREAVAGLYAAVFVVRPVG